MADTLKNNFIPVKQRNITRLTTNFGIGNDCSVRIGNVVYISLFMQVTTAISAWTAFASVPDDCKPEREIQFVIGGGISGYLGPNGQMTARSEIGKGDRALNFVYCIDTSTT